jgi:plasmid stabilization system protein ParE
MHKVVFSPNAENDLHGIYDFIALDDPIYAQKVTEAIVSTTMQLVYFPSMGTALSQSSRMVVEPTFRYTVIYRVYDDVVYISTISKYKNRVS